VNARSEPRIATNVRFRRSVRNAVDEIAELTGTSREDVVNQFLREGVAGTYARLGIERDPAAMAAGLLGVVADVWAAELTDSELDAIETTRAALDRISQLRSRKS
jgi:hypothetical protein